MIHPIRALRGGAFAALLVLASHATAIEVAGVKVDDAVKVGATELVLNGAGIRTRLMFKVYVAGLYLPKKAASVDAVLAGPGPRRMVLRMLRDVDAETFVGALRDGLADNTPEAELVVLRPAIAQLEKVFLGVGAARSGDTIVLDFAADGLVVSVNGAVRGQVGDERFNRALLRVWLGDKPVDSGLRQALLGN